MRTAPPTLDHQALDAAVDAERQRRGLSWRQAAAAIGVSPSTFTRIRRGGLPDATALVRILLWLGQTDLGPYIQTSKERSDHKGQ